LEDRGIEALEESIERLRREVAELRASRTRLVLAADADRRELERELHDGAQQDLVGLAVNLQQIRRLVTTDPAAAGALVDEMRRDVHEGLDRLRALADRIYPPQLETGGLRVALRSAAASVGVRAHIDVAATVVAVPSEASRTVYLCCVGALERFAEGTSATVAVRAENQTLAFEIVADGPGLATADADLAAVRDRVEALGGRLTIASESGATRIAGSLPIR
jgi:signal transduction histidine kinase